VNNVSDKGAEGNNNAGQHGGDEAKDSLQQLANEAHDFDDEGENGFLDGGANDPKETVEKEEDDLIDESNQ